MSKLFQRHRCRQAYGDRGVGVPEGSQTVRQLADTDGQVLSG
jgi:hypothetical protein